MKASDVPRDLQSYHIEIGTTYVTGILHKSYQTKQNRLIKQLEKLVTDLKSRSATSLIESEWMQHIDNFRSLYP